MLAGGPAELMMCRTSCRRIFIFSIRHGGAVELMTSPECLTGSRLQIVQYSDDFCSAISSAIRAIVILESSRHFTQIIEHRSGFQIRISVGVGVRCMML